ncbi:MAG: Anthranilate phosphoribosyltransferase [Candidatus Erwinia impunctatus]
MGQLVNRLGPLLCPFELKGQLVGVSDTGLLQTLACTAHQLGLKNYLFTHASVGADEMLPFGTNQCWWVGERSDRQWNEVVDSVGTPAVKGDLSRLRGGNAAENAQRLQRVLAADDCAEAIDAVTLNAGAALLVAGQVTSVRQGVALAKEALFSGAALNVLRRTQAFCRQLRVSAA